MSLQGWLLTFPGRCSPSRWASTPTESKGHPLPCARSGPQSLQHGGRPINTGLVKDAGALLGTVTMNDRHLGQSRRRSLLWGGWGDAHAVRWVPQSLRPPRQTQEAAGTQWRRGERRLEGMLVKCLPSGHPGACRDTGGAPSSPAGRRPPPCLLSPLPSECPTAPNSMWTMPQIWKGSIPSYHMCLQIIFIFGKRNFDQEIIAYLF